MAKFQNLLLCAVFTVLLVQAMGQIYTDSGRPGRVWHDAHATFYGDMSGGETMQGACGYGNLFQQGYGLETAALSTALFNDGHACGACFQIRCVNDPQWCYNNTDPITITATNFCPPNWVPAPDHWCNPPMRHFDLSMPMFAKLAHTVAGIIPVKYRRVPCRKSGGVKFELKGNPYWLTAMVYNVGGAGDVQSVKIKGSSTEWLDMSRNWGQVWQTGRNIVGQSLSFRVTTSDGKTIEFADVAPSSWKFEQSYEARANF